MLVGMSVLYSHLQHHNDTIIKQPQGQRRKKTSLTTYLPLTLLQGFERVVQGLHVRGCWRPNINFIFWPPLLMTVTLCLSCSLDVQPEVLGSTAGCWLSLLHLISIFSGPQFIRASSPIGLVWLSLPHLVSNSLEVCWQLLWHPTQLNYIIIQRPHDRPLDLWNRMFNRHQAEITVMQFRGDSLPVHHCCGTVGPSPCPILQAFIRPHDLFRLLAIGMCHFLPVHNLGIAFLSRVEGQNITSASIMINFRLNEILKINQIIGWVKSFTIFWYKLVLVYHVTEAVQAAKGTCCDK